MKEKLLNYFNDYYDTTIDNPFENDYNTFALRHTSTKKWFGLLMRIKGRYLDDGREFIDVINVKCEPLLSEIIKKKYNSVKPAYHMNKTKWISIILDGDIPFDEIVSLITLSFELTNK